MKFCVISSESLMFRKYPFIGTQYKKVLESCPHFIFEIIKFLLAIAVGSLPRHVIVKEAFKYSKY